MKRRSDEEISAPLYEYDAAVRAQYGCFAGSGQTGRGPLCTDPVCVAILDPEASRCRHQRFQKLTEKKRDALFDEIKEKALAYRIVSVGPDTSTGTTSSMPPWAAWASRGRLDIVPNLVLVDGTVFRRPADPSPAGGQGDAASAASRCSVHSGQSQPGSLYAGAGQAVPAVSAGKAQGVPYKSCTMS